MLESINTELQRSCRKLVVFRINQYYKQLKKRQDDIEFVFGITPENRERRLVDKYNPRVNFFERSIDGDVVMVWKTWDDLPEN